MSIVTTNACTTLTPYVHKSSMEFIKSEVEKVLLSNKQRTIKQILIPVDPKSLKKIINTLEYIASLAIAMKSSSPFDEMISGMMEVRKTNFECERHRIIPDMLMELRETNADSNRHRGVFMEQKI